MASKSMTCSSVRHHPGVVIVPAALATAERENSTGKEFIAAVVAGYEVMNRVGKAVGTEIMRCGASSYQYERAVRGCRGGREDAFSAYG